MRKNKIKKIIAMLLTLGFIFTIPVPSFAALRQEDSIQEIIIVERYSNVTSGNITIGASVTIHESQQRIIAIRNTRVAGVVTAINGHSTGIDESSISIGSPVIVSNGQYGYVTVSYRQFNNWISEICYFYL